MTGKIQYIFEGEMWQHQAAGWCFVTLPVEMSREIRMHFKWQEEGWGRLKSLAKIGDIQWDTAIWYDTKHESYLLPIKAEIRKKQNLKVGSVFKITLWV